MACQDISCCQGVAACPAGGAQGDGVQGGGAGGRAVAGPLHPGWQEGASGCEGWREENPSADFGEGEAHPCLAAENLLIISKKSFY